MRDTHNDGEPTSRGKIDRRLAEAKVLRDVLFFAFLFGGCALLTALVALALLALLEAFGVWSPAVSEATSFTTENAEQLRLKLRA